MRHYLVTGGLGFLGAPLVRGLLEKGHKVRVLDNLSRGSASRLGNAAHQVEMVNGDIRDAEVVSRSLHGVDSVCHLAYVNGTEFFYKAPEYVLDVGVKGMVNVLDGCVREGVHELILASSPEVYQTPPVVPTDETVPLSIPDPLNPRYSYAGGKIVSELMAINYGRQHFERVLIFRPHNVFGPDMGWEHVIPQLIIRLRRLMIERGRQHITLPIQGTGNQSRAFVYIEDFIAGLMLVLERGKHLNIYNIGTSDEITIRDLSLHIARLMGTAIRVEPGNAAEGGTLRRCPDIGKLRALGYVPCVALEDALRTTIEWYSTHDPLGRVGYPNTNTSIRPA